MAVPISELDGSKAIEVVVTGKVNYFDRAEKEEAKRWLLAES
jgi:hypothetical protein